MIHTLRKTTIDMTQGPIAKELVAFALPLLGGYVFQQLYSTVDSVVVGNFVGPAALGAVTSIMPAINALIGFFLGFSAGSGVIIAQYFGAKDYVRMRRAIHTCICGTVLLGLAITVLGYFLSPVLVGIMHSSPEVAEGSKTYMQVYFLGILSLMLYNMGSAILQAVGDSRRPLLFLMFCSLVNVVLDLVFVVNFHWGVFGVAFATVLSQIASDVLIYVILFRTREIYRLSMSEMRIDRGIIRKIFTIGLPTGFQNFLIAFSNVFVQSYINAFGTYATAAWGVYLRADAFVLMPQLSIAMATTTFVGQNVGAGNIKRVKEGVHNALLIGCTVTIVLSTLFVAGARQFISLFNRDPRVIEYGLIFLHYNTALTIFCCLNQIQASALRGVGDATAPMIIMIFSFVVFRQVYLAVVSRLTTEIVFISIGYPLGWICCTILISIYWRKSRWEKRIAGKSSAGE